MRNLYSEGSYRSFFARINENMSTLDINKYQDNVVSPSNKVSKKWNRLYSECFAHHVSENIRSNETVLRVVENNLRWIPKDHLTSQFAFKHYKLPFVRQPDVSEEEEVDESSCLSFEEFLADICTNAVTNTSENGYRAGSNHVSFLVGNVGDGKTALSTKAYVVLRAKAFATIEKKNEEWIVLPIYLDVGTKYIESHTQHIMDIGDEFFEFVYQKIVSECKSIGPLIKEQSEIESFTSHSTLPKQKLTDLIAHLVTKKIRLLVIVDNLDQYHFQYKKFAFINEYSEDQNESVKKNIGGLIDKFKSDLANPGLGILFVCRKYVYAHLRSVAEKTQFPVLDSDCVYTIQPVTTDDVLQSRHDLWSEAKAKVQVQIGSETGDPSVALKGIELLFSPRALQASPVFGLLRKLSHHGHRGLVDFLCKVAVWNEDEELYSRLFENQTPLLLILYFNNGKKKFTQNNNHFPNMFLNDLSVVADERFPNAKKPHLHTYWLKLLMLKFISQQERVQVVEIVHLFSEVGKYDELLVRVVLGSLSTSEFYCVETEVGGLNNITDDKRVLPTERGRCICSHISGVGSEQYNLDLVFSFAYLQLVVEDWMLAVPRYLYEKFFPQSDYSYIYEGHERYIFKARKTIANRARVVLVFLHILEASLEAEKSVHPKLFEHPDISIPDMAIVRKSIMEEIQRLLKHTGQDKMLKGLIELDKDLTDDIRLKKFFLDYLTSGALVE